MNLRVLPQVVEAPPAPSVYVACAITFASAVVVDGLLARWVAAVAAGRAELAALLSMACACAMLAGFGQAIKGRWPAVTWILGYGLGSWLAVTFGVQP